MIAPTVIADASEDRQKSVPAGRRVDLLGMIELLLAHLTPSLCETVFKRHRKTERERKWTFYAICLFWTAVIVRQPPSLRDGVDQTRKRNGQDQLWPRVLARTQAFFEKAQGQRPGLFMHLYRAFVKSILGEAPEAYASWMKPLRSHFPEIHIVDGSDLDAVAHRLKIVHDERAALLPGSVTVFYDLFRGFCREVLFFPNAAQSEFKRGQAALGWITRGALVVGDRLYFYPTYFKKLTEAGLFGLARRNPTIKTRRLEVLSRRQGGRNLLEDLLVEAGRGAEKQQLRLIRWRGRGGGLDLHTLYASHPNLVAQQVYASALVHTAFRVAQAKIAQQLKVLPEQVSSAKMFPKLAQAANDYAVCQLHADKVRLLDPGVRIRFPSLRTMPFASTTFGAIALERRSEHRRKRRRCSSRERWKSYAHVKGGPTLLKSCSVG